jgi:predicted metal-dependent hydrolase
MRHDRTQLPPPKVLSDCLFEFTTLKPQTAANLSFPFTTVIVTLEHCKKGTTKYHHIMTDLTVRHLLIDLETPPAKHWCAGDAFVTAWMNALSMSFPIGEQFFIDSLRAAAKDLPEAEQAIWHGALQGFVAQEATHRQIHKRFNDHLLQSGMVNGWERRIKRRLKYINHLPPKHHVAITAAYEHFTSIMSSWLLNNQDRLDGTEERFKTLWMWHASEEIEHRSVAFDMFESIDGRLAVRNLWMRRITLVFFIDAFLQTLSNLRRDGSMWKRSTWSSAWRFLFAPGGLLRSIYPQWKDYFKPEFHPLQHNNVNSDHWLQANHTAYRVIKRGA